LDNYYSILTGLCIGNFFSVPSHGNFRVSHPIGILQNWKYEVHYIMCLSNDIAPLQRHAV